MNFLLGGLIGLFAGQAIEPRTAEWWFFVIAFVFLFGLIAILPIVQFYPEKLFKRLRK